MRSTTRALVRFGAPVISALAVALLAVPSATAAHTITRAACESEGKTFTQDNALKSCSSSTQVVEFDAEFKDSAPMPDASSEGGTVFYRSASRVTIFVLETTMQRQKGNEPISTMVTREVVSRSVGYRSCTAYHSGGVNGTFTTIATYETCKALGLTP